MTDTVRRRLASGGLALAGLLAVMVVLALRASEQTSDSLAYMMSAATGREMYHPHHLLYVPIVRWLLLTMHAFGSTADAVFAAQVHNTVLGVAAALTTFLIVRRWGGAPAAAVLAAVALLVSRAFWAYSTLADVYVPATACLAGVTLLLPRRERISGWNTVAITVLLALGILYHQTNVLLIIPIAGWYASLRSRGAWQALGIVLLGTGVLVGGAYVLAYLFSDARVAMAEMGVPAATGFVAGFKRYCLSYTYHPNPAWGTMHNVSPLGVGRLIHSQAWNVVVFSEEKKYLVTGGFAGLLGGLLAWHAWRVLRRGALQRERTYLLLWVVTYGAFFLWWLPSEKEFFITPLFPLVLLAWLLLRDVSARFPGRAGLLTAATALAVAFAGAANLVFAIVPAHRDRGAAFAEAQGIARSAAKECVIYNSQDVIQNLRYYFGFAQVQEIELPYLYALKGGPIPPRFGSAGASCALIPSVYLRPEYRIDELGGYENPAGYLTFVRWILDARADSSGAGWTYRNYDVVRRQGGDPYVRFDATRRAIGSFEQLLARVDADVFAGETGPLAKWWGTTRGVNRSPAASP
jgi:hypothetical protein